MYQCYPAYKSSFFFYLLICTFGCTSTNQAPVFEKSINKFENFKETASNKNKSTYIVRAGDTLTSISKKFNIDIDTLLQLNSLKLSSILYIGQSIKLRPTKIKPNVVFNWPINLKNKNKIFQSSKKDSIIIQGAFKAPIFSSASGKVVYSGNGLKGYGNLIIIKHRKDFITVYAHNHRILVKEGDVIDSNQKIAEMGISKGTPLLHFEMRRQGFQVNPIDYLPSTKNPIN